MSHFSFASPVWAPQSVIMTKRCETKFIYNNNWNMNYQIHLVYLYLYLSDFPVFGMLFMVTSKQKLLCLLLNWAYVFLFCEMYVKFIFVLQLSMKVKSDHRSKFSNLSNWKEEAWKISGLQRDLNLVNPWCFSGFFLLSILLACTRFFMEIMFILLN